MGDIYPRKTSSLILSIINPHQCLDIPYEIITTNILDNDLLLESPGLDTFSIEMRDETKTPKTPLSYCGRVGVGYLGSWGMI